MARNNNNNAVNWKMVVRFFAFVGLIFIGIAILLGNLVNALWWLQHVGVIIAILVMSVIAYEYARSKRNIAFTICWAIAFALALVVLVLQLTGRVF